MLRLVCVSRGCTFLIHSNVSNNDGMHCCAACMKNTAQHGNRCEKVVASIHNTPTVRKVIPETSDVTDPETSAPASN